LVASNSLMVNRGSLTLGEFYPHRLIDSLKSIDLYFDAGWCKK
jgi:hypothetical protein